MAALFEVNLGIRSPTQVKSGKIFEVGEYPDKGFSLTEEEADAAIDAFFPADLSVEHTNSIFDGLIGTIQRIWRRGKEIFGEFSIPQWLVDITAGNPLKVSTEWSTDKKKLTGCAIVLDPRVHDAVVMAAFGRKAQSTPHGADRIQMLHDIAAEAGATCSKNMTSRRESGVFQKVHDLMKSEGAFCRLNDGSGFSRPAERGLGDKKHMKLADLFKVLSGAGVEIEDAPASAPVAAMSAEDKASIAQMKSDFSLMLADLDTTKQALVDARAAIAGGQVVSIVDDAIRTFKLAPAQRDAAIAVGKADIVALNALIEKAAPVVGFRRTRGTVDGTEKSGEPAGEQIARMSNERAKKDGITVVKATMLVLKENPELAQDHADSAPSYGRAAGGN